MHGGQEPRINFDVKLLREYTRYKAVQKVKSGAGGDVHSMKKNIICIECNRCFNDIPNLKGHMKNIHPTVEQFIVTESNFIYLPEVKSTYLRCFPCNIGFNSLLAYKLHIKDKHKSGLFFIERHCNLEAKIKKKNLRCVLIYFPILDHIVFLA